MSASAAIVFLDQVATKYRASGVWSLFSGLFP
jgi:hypothetical protein